MSRTYRRKNYENTKGSSWRRRGRKVAGFYTVKEHVKFWVESPHYKAGGYYSSIYGTYVYRAPSRDEYNKAWRRIHRDCAESPTVKGYIEYLDACGFRQTCNHELFKFMKNSDYEPMIEKKPMCFFDSRY